MSASWIAVCAALTSLPTPDKPSDQVKFSGYLDTYYQWDFGRPKVDLSDRLFDVRHNRVDLAEADLDVVKSPNARDPFGVTLMFIAGKSADLLNATEPGGKDFLKFIGQGYVTYSAGPVTLDIGKFYTWIGYESYYSPTQANYGRGLVNTLAQPDTHTGFRFAYTANPKVTLNAYAVNGWNETKSTRGLKSGGLGITLTPDSKSSVTLQSYFGDEGSNATNDAGSFGGIGFPVPGVFRVAMADFIASYQLSVKTKLAVNFDYASAGGTSGGGSWDGEAFYLQQTLSNRCAATLRLERMRDTAGLRTGSPGLFHSITGTYDWNLSPNAMLRFEVRHDFADGTVFPTNGGASSQRTTVTFAQVLHF